MTRPEGTPTGYFVILPPNVPEESRVDVGEVLRILMRRWWQGVLVALVGGIAVAAFVLNMPNQYESRILLAPVNSDPAGAAGMLRNQLGGLASLAGINLGGGGGDRKAEAVAMLSAEGFLAGFVKDEDLLPVLFADRWDQTKGTWRDQSRVPTVDDGVRKFKKLQRVSDDRKTGLVTMVIRWTDRELAARWANGLVGRLNEQLRRRAIDESALRIEYLNQELAKSDVVAFREAIFGLIEQQMNASMLANVQREYAFRTVDPALPADPKRKVAPPRSIFVLAGALALVVLWAALVLWRERRVWLAAPGAASIAL